MSQVLITGATGLVGGHLLRLLIQAPGIAAITAATRRPLADAEGGLNPHAPQLSDALAQWLQEEHPGFKPRIARRARSFLGDYAKNCRIIHFIVEIYRHQHKQRIFFVTPQQAIRNPNKGKGNRHAQDSL